MPDATLVLLAHNPGSHELETAAQVRSQRYPAKVHLLVIDSSLDTSCPANRTLRQAADDWLAISPESFGHAATRNRAVDLCTTPIIVFLSQDAHPADERWLASLVRPLVAGDAAASYGRQRPPSPNAEREATFSYLYPAVPEIKRKADIGALGLRTFHFSDVTSAFLTDVLRRVRFPDELPAFEDIGVAKRLLDAGYRIAYVPAATVVHAHELGPRSMFERYRQIGVIYERLGIFEELRRVRSGHLLTEGLRVLRAVAPRSGRGVGPWARRVAVGGVKVGGVAWGRWQARRQVNRSLTVAGQAGPGGSTT